jgi:hypothetical protein
MNDLVIVRAVRPYATESDWLHEEAWTIGRKSVYLVGIAPQPEGTRVRCELALRDGRQLLVAEGVVIKYAADNRERPPGLVVRYRRLSTASSQFIDRVINARDSTDQSSPSVTENSLLKTEMNSQLDATEHASAQSATARDLALGRLRGRQCELLATPQECLPALDRLRMRSAKGM